MSDFATRNPAAWRIHGQDALYVLGKSAAYGKCELVLKTYRRVLTDVVNLCAPATLWLAPPSHRVDAD